MNMLYLLFNYLKQNLRLYPWKTNMAMENPAFEDVFLIENRISHCHVSFFGRRFFLIRALLREAQTTLKPPANCYHERSFMEGTV